MNLLHDNCYGCGVCVSVCPSKAISLKMSSNGFWQPSILQDHCVKCNLCSTVCAFHHDELAVEKRKIHAIYALWLKDLEKLKKTASGGAATAIAESLLAQGWKVLGVTYDTETNTAKHIKISSMEELPKIVNTKYLQSYPIDDFEDLFDGSKYLIFGTPCQIASIRRLIQHKKMEDHFLLVDFFCHGVPSYLLWFSYLKHKLSKGERVQNVNFRNKQNGWHSYTLRIDTNLRSIVTTEKDGDFFFQLFLGRCSMNAPCYQCKYHDSAVTAADIRIGDFWGPQYADNQTGVSRVLSMTERGDSLIQSLSERATLLPQDLEIVSQWPQKKHVPDKNERNRVSGMLKSGKSLRFIVYYRNGKMMLGKLIPSSLKTAIKQCLKR